MALDDILVHVGTPFRMAGSGAWIEGERDVEPTRLTPFACVLFLPIGTEDTSGGFRPRQVQVPTLLYGPRDVSGQAVRLGPNDELFVLAPELVAWTGAEEARWKVDGFAQPAGKPGEDPVVVQARLSKVTD